MNESVVKSKNIISGDEEAEKIRPSQLDSFIGQEQLRNNLRIFIQAAKNRGDALDHVLFHGPPGLGKTTLAQIVSREMEVNFKATSGPILTKAGDLAALLTNLEQNDVLFIDEIHRLSTTVEEILYSAMEDFTLDLIIGEGPAARSVRIDLPKFTLVGATTRIGLLTNPLRDRFGIPLRLEFYSPHELIHVILRGAGILNMELTEDGAKEIATRSRGTPRIAIRLLRRVRDFASVSNTHIVDAKLADHALRHLEVDKIGLDSADRRYMHFITDYYSGGPVGIETIAAGLSEQRDSLEETIEPYLIQIGFLQRTPRGRVITPGGFQHLGIKAPKAVTAQIDLLEVDNEA